MVQDTKESYRTHVTMGADDIEMLNEVSQGIGCSRAAVVDYLLAESMSRLHSIPSRARVKCVRDTRLLLKGRDDFMQRVVRESRGSSQAYIETQLEGLLTLQKARYDTYS